MYDRIMMTASVLTRMGAGLLLFVLMARGLGPADYGLVATVFSYATLGSLLTDFGYGSKTLRDIAANRGEGGAIISESLGVKIYLTLPVILSGAVAISLTRFSFEAKAGAILLGLAILIGAIGDLAITAYRAVGRYTSEAVLTLWTSVLHLILIGWVSLSHGDVLMLAIAYVVSRTLYTIVAIFGVLKLFDQPKFLLPPLRHALASMKGAWGWAADSGLGYLTGQMDGVLVAAIFGLQAAGIYQAGARFIQSALNLVSILAAVHIPRIAKSGALKASVTSSERAMMIEFSLAGVLLGIVFWQGGPLITKLLLGRAYSDVNTLWTGFSVFVVLRYIAASFGAGLSARGMPITRIAGQITGAVVIAAGVCLVAPRLGLGAVPWIMCAATLATVVAYATARVLIAKGRLDRRDFVENYGASESSGW